MVALLTKQLKRAARIILVGAPGVGKGTQAERLMRRYPQLSALSSGDLLRNAVADRTPLGLEVESHLKAGSLVPDETMLSLISSELCARDWISDAHAASNGGQATASDDPAASFILDGFPRTALQASRLDALVPVNFVVSLMTPIDIIISRIANRWVHVPSGRIYNVGFNNPEVEGKDDITGEPLTQREDDNEETWRKRLSRFNETSDPLLDHYDRKGILWRVQGNSSDEISPKLFTEFERRFCA